MYICVSVTEPSEPCGFTEHAVETKASHRHTACFVFIGNLLTIYIKKMKQPCSFTNVGEAEIIFIYFFKK